MATNQLIRIPVCFMKTPFFKQLCKCNFSTKSNGKTTQLLENSGVMGSYANALFMVSSAKGNSDKVMADLTFISESINSCNDFATFISTPGLRTVEKIDFLRTELKALGINEMQNETLNCIEMLLEQKRSSAICLIAKHFETLYLLSKGQIKCDVTSAAELTETQKKDLTAGLLKRLKPMKPIVQYKINPVIVGGLVVKIGDQLIDASVATKVERMQSQLAV
ncbi:bifunctional F1F0 ATP synthase OSCP-delta subunit [Babesia duncani]|uniref:Bifunctional F1F0 ATP synthase OSCP-delta subunit n=1 Tax=Babesia duncani TaxID=323732 RepID=A0AAD9PL50_9APIC|nr:bifunctional F1F0 ATP synthase OSCP-delta subunit [Babesia duncani]